MRSTMAVPALFVLLGFSAGCEVEGEPEADASDGKSYSRTDPTGDNTKTSLWDDEVAACQTTPNDDGASDIVEYFAVSVDDVSTLSISGDDSGGADVDPIALIDECDNPLVFCDPTSLSMGDEIMVYAQVRTASPIAESDDGCRFVALVMETDGDPTNDWVPQAEFACDYFQGTDLWVKWERKSDGTTSASATQVDSSQNQNESSVPYRVVRDGDTTHFFVSAAGFPSPNPSARLVTFNDPSCEFDFTQLHGDVSGDSPLDPPQLIDTQQ